MLLTALSALLAAGVVGQSAGLQGMEIVLDGTWSIANTSRDEDQPIMVAIKVDEQLEGNSPMLVLTCEGAQGIQVYINWSGGRILPANRLVTYQIDNDEPRRSTWKLSADGYATFFPYAGKVGEGGSATDSPAKFAERLAEGRRLKASVIVGRETPRTASFRLDGTAEALRQVRDGCDAKPSSKS